MKHFRLNKQVPFSPLVLHHSQNWSSCSQPALPPSPRCVLGQAHTWPGWMEGSKRRVLFLQPGKEEGAGGSPLPGQPCPRWLAQRDRCVPLQFRHPKDPVLCVHSSFLCMANMAALPPSFSPSPSPTLGECWPWLKCSWTSASGRLLSLRHRLDLVIWTTV